MCGSVYAHCLIGLGVRASASKAADLGSIPPLRFRSFSGSSHTSDFKISTANATLPGTWYFRAGTGWSSVSILWLGEIKTLMCNFYISVAAHTLVSADPSLRYTSILLGCKATNQQTMYACEYNCLCMSMHMCFLCICIYCMTVQCCEDTIGVKLCYIS